MYKRQLLEGYGYPTIEADANAFFGLTGLPLLTSSTFKIVYPEGKPVDPNAGVLTGWDIEIALDVQWAHSIAPGAKIVVVAANGQDNEDFQDAISYITKHHLGDSVNDSWEEDTDLVAGPLEQQSYDQVLKIAAAKGISFNFSTGDSGDEGLGSPIGAAGVPSNSPHATAVGGTSILNKVHGSGYETLGWGGDFVELNNSGVLDPPVPQPFFGGSGGGESVFFPKPSWQKDLPGTGRQTPDISALADPFTGVPIVVTEGGVQGVQAGWGGTSLACPIFTAFWAIADQKAGHSLGLAGPAIAALKPGVLVDVLPLSSPTNVTGTIVDQTGATFYSATALFAGQIFGSTGFTSAVWDVGGGEDLALAFGLDTSLTVTKGWDNVTAVSYTHLDPAGYLWLELSRGDCDLGRVRACLHPARRPARDYVQRGSAVRALRDWICAAGMVFAALLRLPAWVGGQPAARHGTPLGWHARGRSSCGDDGRAGRDLRSRLCVEFRLLVYGFRSGPARIGCTRP